MTNPLTSLHQSLQTPYIPHTISVCKNSIDFK